MLQCNKNQDAVSAKSTGGRRYIAGTLLVALAVLIAGCESVPDVVNPVKWFEDDEPPAADGAGQDFPRLSSVPERPVAPSLETQQAEIREGLVADQENARYTESEVQQEATRRQTVRPGATGPRVSAVPQAPARSVPAPVVRPAVPSAPSADASAIARPTVRPAVPPPPAVVPRPRVAAPSPQSTVAPRVAAAVPAPPAPPPPAPASPTVRAPVPPQPSVAPRLVAPRNTSPSPATSGVQLSQPTKVGTIYFADNSRSLQPADVAILEQIAAAQRVAGNRLRVTGHASGRARTFDSGRRSKINYDVSLKRANTVVSALVSLGVPRNRILVEALGDTAPLYAEYTAAGEAANRRAEIWMIN